MESGFARCKMPSEFADLLTSDICRAIHEANLGQVNTQIAQRYYIDQIAQMDIAVEFGLERSTVTRRLQKMAPRISSAALRLPPS